MSYSMQSLTCDPARLKGLSERLIVSHYENNYGGAVKRLNAITAQLADLDPATAPTYLLNGLKREELIAANSMLLHEIYFDGLGESDGPIGEVGSALARDFGDVGRWRAEFIAMGKALGGGSGWVLLTYSPRDGRRVNQWAADHTHALAGATPILALDMSEHSYHMDYGAKAAAYVDAFMQNVDWNKVATCGDTFRTLVPARQRDRLGVSHALDEVQWQEEASMEKMIAGITIVVLAMSAQAEAVDFDKERSGTLPAGWAAGVTGRGTPRWTVESDSDAPSPPNVLQQSGSGDFPWCVKKGVSLADGFVEVKFKPLSGREDQAGGLVWRWKDGDNYYVARANALENNVALYFTESGRRKTIKYVDAPVPGNTWHLLRAEFRGSHIRVLLDGKAYITLDDSHIPGPGTIGVWTKADSVTLFDDFAYGPAGP